MTESEEELKSLLMQVKEESEKPALKLSSVQFTHSVVSDSLRPHESQHARPPCPSPTPGVHSDSRPSSLWWHPSISSSVVPFSSCPQSLPASGSFPLGQLFAWGGQSPGVSASASFLPKKSQTSGFCCSLAGQPSASCLTLQFKIVTEDGKVGDLSLINMHYYLQNSWTARTYYIVQGTTFIIL